jgi:hypothetical protein
MTNPNPFLGPTWQIGSSFFHVVVEYNVVYRDSLLRGVSRSSIAFREALRTHCKST